MSELNLDANYGVAREERVEGDDGTFATVYVVDVEVQEQKFNGRGSTEVLAKALAAEQALIRLFNIDFEHSHSKWVRSVYC